MNKLILYLFRKRIKRLVEDYEFKKDYYVGKKYLESLKSPINKRKALLQQIDIPSISEGFGFVLDMFANAVAFILFLVCLLVCLFYSFLKVFIFPFRLYILMVTTKEILKQILQNEK